MKRRTVVLTCLAVSVLTLILAACASIKSIPGLPDSHPMSLAPGQQISCAECHDDSERGTMKALTSFSHSRPFVKNHRLYVARDDRTCAACHKTSFCTDCHTNQTEMKPSIKQGNRPDREMPHRGNFMTTHKIEGKLDPASCYRCHGRANNQRCITCHR